MHHFNNAKNLLITFFCLFHLAAASQTKDEVDLYKRPKLSATGSVNKSFVHVNHPLVTVPAKSAAAGGGLSFELPFSRYFAAGIEGSALFELDKEAPIYYDGDIFAKSQFGFDNVGSVYGNYYVKAPVGVSIMQWSEQMKKLSIGFNAGAFFGHQFYFARHFGLFAEVGYRYRYLPSSSMKLYPNEKIRFHFHVIEANLGLTVIF